MAARGQAGRSDARSIELSVVVPTKGRPQYLRGCLSALRGSDFPRERFEVVIVNDGGGEETAAVIDAFSELLSTRVIVPARSGPSAARNAGVRAAAGRFVALTDDDCEPAPGWISALHAALDESPDAAVGGRTLNGVTDSAAAIASQAVVDALHGHMNRSPQAPRFFASSNLALGAAAFDAVGGFDEGFRYAEDREFCERWLRSGRRLVRAPEAVVHPMRAPTLGGFIGQHHGYGRGAWAYRHAYRSGGGVGDSLGVVGALIRESGRPAARRSPVRTAGYLALSQVATASGFVREACAARLNRSRPPVAARR